MHKKIMHVKKGWEWLLIIFHGHPFRGTNSKLGGITATDQRKSKTVRWGLNFYFRSLKILKNFLTPKLRRKKEEEIALIPAAHSIYQSPKKSSSDSRKNEIRRKVQNRKIGIDDSSEEEPSNDKTPTQHTHSKVNFWSSILRLHF